MRFEQNFRLVSYAAVFCGFLSLWVSGTFSHVGTALFIAVMIAAWFLEDSRWQISERLGTVLIVFAMPLYYLLWRYRFFDFANSEDALPGILARLILTLTAVKLLQKKGSRDWIFLYLMSFFQLLLAAGLSISVGYLLSFAAYIVVMACAVMMFEVKRTNEQVAERSTLPRGKSEMRQFPQLAARHIVLSAIVIILITAAVAIPTFFVLPRVGGAGIGGNSGGVSTLSGFSDSVRLGGIGRIQQNDEVVMRVRLESGTVESPRWRGIALDTFDGQTWSRTRSASKEPRAKNDRDLIQVDNARPDAALTLQTVYLEPLDTPMIFGLHRMVGIQGNFPVLYRDVQGSISFQRTGERVSYKLASDTEVPTESKLRADRSPYSVEFSNYLQLPQKLDPRIAKLAGQITANTHNRFDAAQAVERHLQNEYGYTLEQKASGSDPLADFLFDKREGHCEYFATAMAVMLRTQGISSRVVNGFQRGDYNDAADVFVVRQRNAHSWVEVYFPGERAWVTFDPTPAAGQGITNATFGFTEQVRKYIEALETLWIQYFVAFDSQEQRSLFTSVRKSVFDIQDSVSLAFSEFQTAFAEWWKNVRGDNGFTVSMTAVAMALLYLAGGILFLFVISWLVRKIVKLKVWTTLWDRLFARRHATVVGFYERMLSVLASKGFKREPHQTPLEFAYAAGIPEVVCITEKYNSVRFGVKCLSSDDTKEIETWLKDLEEN